MITQEKINPDLTEISQFVVKIEFEPMKYLSTERREECRIKELPSHLMYKQDDCYCKACVRLKFFGGNTESFWFESNEEGQEYFDNFFNKKQ
jgi:hypothetical protein